MSGQSAQPSKYLDNLKIEDPPPLLDHIAALGRLALPVEPLAYTPLRYDPDTEAFFAVEDPPAQRYLIPAPIEMLRIEVHEEDGFERLVELIGVEGLACFFEIGPLEAFTANLGYHARHGLEAEPLFDMWGLNGMEWFQTMQSVIRAALKDAATHNTLSGALQALTGFRPGHLHHGLQIRYRADTHLAMASPRNPLQQLWLEIVARVIDSSLAPRVCEHCGYPFAPRRQGQRYCPDTRCADNAAKARRKQDPAYRSYERDYQRMYRRWQRGRLDQADWEQWKQDNPSPRRRTAHESKED